MLDAVRAAGIPPVHRMGVAGAREQARRGAAANGPGPELPAVTDETIRNGGAVVPIRRYQPCGTEPAAGRIIYVHGGGWVLGGIGESDHLCRHLAHLSGLEDVSVGFRLAPEHPFPAALDDVYAVLVWAAEHATELGIEPDRIAVGGHSAGANLAAAVALRARDQQGPRICFQLLNEPSLDDRQETWSQRNFTDTPWATRAMVAASWKQYLGSASPSPYAAPARATDLSGLPPAYIASAEFCPNRDENIEYALRLLRSGVSVELHQWAGTFHGSQAILSAEVSQRQITELTNALRRALARGSDG